MPWDGFEHNYLDYDVVVGYGEWTLKSDGAVPKNAFNAGHLGENLYVCRARFAELSFGNVLTYLVPGKLHPKDKGCYVPFRGREHFFVDYEVLIDPSIP